MVRDRASERRENSRESKRDETVRKYCEYTANGWTLLDLAIDERRPPYSTAMEALEGLVDMEHPVVKAREDALPTRHKVNTAARAVQMYRGNPLSVQTTSLHSCLLQQFEI
jgi:hypothetical protein